MPFEDTRTGILSQIAALGEKYDFLIGACNSAEWLELCLFLPLGAYRVCCAVAREHPLARKTRLSIEDLYGQTLIMGKRGDAPAVDAVRDEVERHPAIHIEDTSQFYDMEVFNRCAQTHHVLLTLECWSEVHPGLVTLPVDWDFRVPYGVLYAKDAPEDILRFLTLIAPKRTAADLGTEWGESL